jgi:hypothetical protein
VTFTGPYLDDAETWGHDFVGPASIAAPFLDGGFGFGHAIAEVDPPGLEVLVNGTPIANTKEREFEDPIGDVGSYSFKMAETDFTGVDFDDLITIRRQGQARFMGVVDDIARVTLAQGDEASQTVTVSGNGSLSILRRGFVRPSRGPGALPTEVIRSFSWPAPDFDDTAWPLAKQINRQREYANWRAPLPWIWPDTSGYWIWADRADCTSNHAPSGVCLFRKEFDVDGPRTVKIFCAFDNRGILYVDGAEVTDFQSFTEGRYIELELSDGTHYIAARVENLPNGQTINPGGFIAAGYTVGAGGLLDDLLFHTDGTWKCLPYPATAPGFTHGDVLIRLLEENQGDGGRLDEVTWDFTPTLDSAGEPWSSYREVAVNVGRNLEDVALEMADAFIDVAMAPGSLTLRAWNSGTRGTTKDVTLTQTDDPATSDFLDLRHRGKRARLNRAFVRYARGDFIRDDTASITAHGQIAEYLELGAIKGEAEAVRVTDQVMANRAEPAYSTTAILKPHNTAATPYDGDWEVGDTIGCLNEDSDNEAMRVRSIAMREDAEGNVTWPVGLRDLHLELEERHDRWLRRMADGANFGGSRVSSPAGEPRPAAIQITALQVARFSYDTSQLAVSESQNDPAAGSGNIVELYGELKTAGSTTTTVAVKIRRDGSWSTLGTLTFAAGVTETETGIVIEPVRANIDKLQASITAAGTGAQGLVVQVRAI